MSMLIIDRCGEAAGALCDALSGADYVARLERMLSGHAGKPAVALCSADAAIHAALKLSGVRHGDYVFVPTFTFYTNIATVVHAGAIPVFVDCDVTTRCVSAAALEQAFVWAQLQNKPPRAVVIDNAFGSVADYNVLLPLCKSFGVATVELAGDAFGGEYNGVPCGANADYGVYNFAKHMCGGGGAIVCGGDDVNDVREFARYTYSERENHDYKMHNCIAALDCAQVVSARKIIARAKSNLIALSGAECVARPVVGDAATYALCKLSPQQSAELAAAGFETKRVPPVHTLPQYAECEFFEHEQGFSASAELAEYSLIDIDMSTLRRIKLVSMLKSFSAE